MKRMFFKNNKREKKEPMDIDITSLLDVLVILLVFLLKSYNASDLKLNLVKNLTVPTSDARLLGNHTVIVQVDSKKAIYVNKEQVGFALGTGENQALLAKLNDIRSGISDRLPASKKEKKINLVFDEGLPYKVMKSVMHTSAVAGYTEFKFIVQGNY
jgi:biopolymer transport protein ExbD